MVQFRRESNEVSYYFLRMVSPGLTLISGLGKWIRRHFFVMTVNLSASINLIYLQIKNQKCLASTISVLCLAGTCLYFRRQARHELNPHDLIVITGCDSGLGYSLAMHCKKLGASVLAGVLNTESPGARKLSQSGVSTLHLDLLDHSNVEFFAEQIEEILEKNNLILRAFINNACVMVFGEFEWQTDTQLCTQVMVNFLGAMNVTRKVMPMIRAHGSRIIVISSDCAWQPLPGNAAYCASKAAIQAWATSLRVELNKYGIPVISFVPGSFPRESNILARQSEHFEAMRDAMSKEARQFYGSYFTRYANYFKAVSVEVEPRMVGDRKLYETFEHALLNKYPSAFYTCEPWRYFYRQVLYKVVPVWLRDLLIERYVQLPSWDWRDDMRSAVLRVSAINEDESTET